MKVVVSKECGFGLFASHFIMFWVLFRYVLGRISLLFESLKGFLVEDGIVSYF